MNVLIDQDRCQGHGRCYSTAPGLFVPKDDYGHAEAVGGGCLQDPAELDQAKRAADACPERAITVVTSSGDSE